MQGILCYKLFIMENTKLVYKNTSSVFKSEILTYIKKLETEKKIAGYKVSNETDATFEIEITCPESVKTEIQNKFNEIRNIPKAH